MGFLPSHRCPTMPFPAPNRNSPRVSEAVPYQRNRSSPPAVKINAFRANFRCVVPHVHFVCLVVYITWGYGRNELLFATRHTVFHKPTRPHSPRLVCSWLCLKVITSQVISAPAIRKVTWDSLSRYSWHQSPGEARSQKWNPTQQPHSFLGDLKRPIRIYLA